MNVGLDNPLQATAPCSDELIRKDTYNVSTDARKSRKAVFRRTIDYNAAAINYLRNRMWISRDFDKPMLQPDCLWSPKLCPPRSYMDSPMNCVMSKPVRTSTNKNKCPIYCVCWTPEGRRLITGAFSGEFTLWNGLTFNFETILQAHESQIRCMKWSHNEEWLLTADHSGYVKYWQANMNNVEMYQAHKEPIRGVSFCPFDNKFVTCSDDSTVRIWDFHRCAEERVLRGHGSDVRSVAWHPVLSLIISGSKDAQQPIKLWDPKTGESVSTLYVHKNTCTDVAWNDNGNWFLTASRDHLIKLFDLRNLKSELQTFRGHKRDVMRVAWHPFHECLFASGSADGAIFYWMAGTDTELGAVDNAHESMIWSLAWHPFGHILVSGANDFATKFWTRNRPGDVLKETLNNTGIDTVLHSSNANITLSSALSFNELDGTDNSFNEDLLRHLAASSDGIGRTDIPDEVAFVNNPNDASSVEIPGLNEGPVADLNVTETEELEDREKNKLRNNRTIPKEFAFNWASTRVNVMPTVMMPAPNPSTLAAAAAAAAVAVNNLNVNPQYLPPVKPLSVTKECQAKSVTSNNDSSIDNSDMADQPMKMHSPRPVFDTDRRPVDVRHEQNNVNQVGNPTSTSAPYTREADHVNVSQPYPDMARESNSWSSRNRDHHKPPPEPIPQLRSKTLVEHSNREPFDHPHVPTQPYHGSSHRSDHPNHHRIIEDRDYREFDRGEPNDRFLNEEHYYNAAPPRRTRRAVYNDGPHIAEHGRHYPPNEHVYDRRADRYPPIRSSSRDEEQWSRGWSDDNGPSDRFDYGQPIPRRLHRDGRAPHHSYHSELRPPPSYPPPHKRPPPPGAPPPEHMSKYPRPEPRSKPWGGHNHW